MPTAVPDFTRDVYADYGLYGLIVVFVIQWAIKTLVPIFSKRLQQERDRAEKRKERTVKAMETQAAATQGIQVLLAAQDVRLAQIVRDIGTVKDCILVNPPADTKPRRKVPAMAGD